MNITHSSHKTSHNSPSKIVYIYIFAIVTMHIYTITIAMHTIILLISKFRTFFSLSSPCAKRTQSQTSPFFIFFFFSLDTPKNTHTNTCTQTNQHKDTQTHPHKTNQQRERERERERERDWCWCWPLVDQWMC